MSIQPSSTYLISTGLCHCCPAKSAQQRSNQEYASSQSSALSHKSIALEKVQIQFVCLERIVVPVMSRHFYADVLEQKNQIVHIQDVGNVADAHLFSGENRGTHHLKSLVLRPLRGDRTLQPSSSFNDERLHCYLFLRFFSNSLS